MAYVYILKSLRDGRYYLGSTTNLKARLRHHLIKATPSTARFGDLELVFKQEYPTIKSARYIERRLKRLKRKDYLDTIINDGFIKIKPDIPA